MFNYYLFTKNYSFERMLILSFYSQTCKEISLNISSLFIQLRKRFEYFANLKFLAITAVVIVYPKIATIYKRNIILDLKF